MSSRSIDVDCACVSTPDVGFIDRIARLQLAARNLGFQLRLVNVDQALLELVDLCGLAEPLGVEPERHPEQRKQSRGVEEESDLGDPSL